MLDMVKKKLYRWKGKTIFMTGRVTLIKAIISSMCLYLLSLFNIPKVVCNEFNKIQPQFLWGWGLIERK